MRDTTRFATSDVRPRALLRFVGSLSEWLLRDHEDPCSTPASLLGRDEQPARWVRRQAVPLPPGAAGAGQRERAPGGALLEPPREAAGRVARTVARRAGDQVGEGPGGRFRRGVGGE